jgi:hypothetical protein
MSAAPTNDRRRKAEVLRVRASRLRGLSNGPAFASVAEGLYLLAELLERLARKIGRERD